jgi:hypothetical protein
MDALGPGSRSQCCPPTTCASAAGYRARAWHKPSFHSVLKGRCARAERETFPARQLHARVTPHARETLRAGRPVADLLSLTQGSYRFVDG